jgi:hypothetical protein
MSYMMRETGFPGSVVANSPLTLGVNGATYTFSLDKSQMLATTALTGLVKVGTTLKIGSDGTLDLSDSLQAAIISGGVPIATESVVGISKPGTTLKIAGDGTLDLSDAMKAAIDAGGVPVATTTTAGIVKVGSRLTVAVDGTINAPLGTAIAPGVLSVGSRLTVDGSGVVNAPIATSGAVGVVKAGSRLTVDGAGDLNVPIATPSATGVVKAGTTLKVDGAGLLDLSDALQAAIAGGGGGGGTAYSEYMTRAQISATAISATTQRIVTTGYATVGDIGGGAIYKRGSSTGPHALQDSAGVWWELDLKDKPYVIANWFGMVADGSDSYNFGTGETTRTGTDNAPMIQAAINAAIQANIRVVAIKDGIYATNDVIHVGWGNNTSVYVDIELVAASGGRAAFAGLAGVTLLPKQTDRPCINLQGVRMGRIAGIGIIGYNYAYIYYAALPNAANINLPATWLKPSLVPSGSNPGGYSRYAPYAAITVDAYKGTAQSNTYPAVTYPAWTGSNTQYGKAASSDITFEDLYLSGFAVGIVSPSASDANADFMKIRDCSINCMVYAIAMSHSQSRAVDIDSNTFDRCHTAMTNGIFSVQIGEFAGPVTNNTFGGSYQIFDFSGGLSFLGPMTFKNCYFESTARYGSFAGSSAYPSGLNFDSCLFDTVALGHHNMLPGAMIVGTGRVNLRFSNCRLVSQARIFNLCSGITGDVVIDGGCTIGGTYWTGGNGSTAMQRAVNYCGGMLIGGGDPFGRGYPAFFPRVRSDRALNAIKLDDSFAEGSRLVGGVVDFMTSAGLVNRTEMSQYAEAINDAHGQRWRFRQGGRSRLLDFADNTAIIVALDDTDDSWTFHYANALQNDPASAMHVGCIIYHNNTGTIFVVTAIGAADAGNSNAYPITMVQQNNLRVDNSGDFVAQLLTDMTLSGYSLIIDTQIWLPRQVHYGTFTSGSTSVSSVSRGDGYGGNLTTYLLTSDKIYAPTMDDATAPKCPVANGTGLNAVTNGSPGSLTLSANATASGRFPIYPIPLAA